MTPLNGFGNDSTVPIQLDMTHLYITCENWEGLKGIKEPQISAQDQQEKDIQ